MGVYVDLFAVLGDYRFCLAFPNLKFVWPCLDRDDHLMFMNSFRDIDNGRADAIAYAPRIEDGVVNPLGRAAPSVFSADPDSWRGYLSRASMLKLLLRKAHKKVADLDEDMFTEEEWRRLRGISVWPLIAKTIQIQQRRRRRI